MRVNIFKDYSRFMDNSLQKLVYLLYPTIQLPAKASKVGNPHALFLVYFFVQKKKKICIKYKTKAQPHAHNFQAATTGFSVAIVVAKGHLSPSRLGVSGKPERNRLSPRRDRDYFRNLVPQTLASVASEAAAVFSL